MKLQSEGFIAQMNNCSSLRKQLGNKLMSELPEAKIENPEVNYRKSAPCVRTLRGGLMYLLRLDREK